MNESIGGANLFNIFFVLLGIIIAVFATSFIYTKAYRAKSIVIKEIENSVSSNGEIINQSNVIENINSDLKKLGYGFPGKECSDLSSNKELIYPTDDSTSSYCIYKVTESDKNGNTNIYYEIIAYMHYNIPFFNFTFPVKGHTRSYRNIFHDIELEEDEL